MQTLGELLEQCHPESPIERRLVENLYPALPYIVREKLSAQYPIHLPPNTYPDFVFAYAQIAIYCDSYKHHGNKERFYEDRYQTRELQLLGWIVLRFTGSEINSQIDKVIDTILRALELRGVDVLDNHFSNDAEAFYRRGLLESGRATYDNGGKVNYDHAIENFTKAIESKPDFAEAFHSRAYAHFSKDDYTRAIVDYTQAIKLNPESPYPYWGRGSTYAKRGERKLAEQDYATATHLENENVR